MLRRPIPFPLLALALGLAWVPGCSREFVTVKQLEVSDAASWNGRSVAELESVWGPPHRQEADGKGGRILTYEKLRIDRGEDRAYPGERGSIPEPTSGPTVIPGSPIATPRDVAEFRVDADGLIYRYRIAGSHRDRADLRPPPRSRALP